MPRSEIKAFLPIERSLGSLAYDAMRSHADSVIKSVKSDIHAGRFADAHHSLRDVDFAAAARAVEDHAHVYLKSAFMLGASRVHGSLANTPSHAIKRLPDHVLENVTKVHRDIVSQRAAVIVKGALANLIRKAQVAHHEGSLRKADLQTLYVQRKLLNADDLIAWAKANGFPKCVPPEEMHVTIAHSKAPVDWSIVPADQDGVEVWDGLRRIRPLGDKGAVCLLFRNAFLKDRWQMLKDAGAEWSWPGFQPHVTITYDNPFPDYFDFSQMDPYEGKLVFGPELYQPINDGWSNTLVEKFEETVRLRKDAVSDLADALNSAVDGNAQMMASAAANITTTRMCAYGFLVEASANAVAEYQLRAVLDDRTTQICEELNGRTFKVEQALNFMDTVLSATDPENLKALDPFLNDTQATVDRLSNMSDDELQANGVMVPPFHFGCRTTLELVSDVTIEDQQINVEPTDEGAISDATAADVEIGGGETVGVSAPIETDQDALDLARENVAASVDDLVAGGADIPQELIDKAHNVDALDDQELEDLLNDLGLDLTGAIPAGGVQKAEPFDGAPDSINDDGEETEGEDAELTSPTDDGRVRVQKDGVDSVGMIHGSDGKFTGYAGGSSEKVKGQLAYQYSHVKTTPQYYVVKNKYTGKDKWIEKTNIKNKIVEIKNGQMQVYHAVDKPKEPAKGAFKAGFVKETPKYYVGQDGETGKQVWAEKDKHMLVTEATGVKNIYEKPTGAAVQSTANTTATAQPMPTQLQPKAVNTTTDQGTMDVSGWKKVGDQKGSNPGGTYQDPNGNKWYVKTPKSEDHAKNELLANKLYQLAGVKVPEVRQAAMDGKPAVASKIVFGDTLAKTPYYAAGVADAQKSFAADAWLANRDSVGQGKDNMIVVPGDGVTRIDQGGALKYRAQGSPKNDFGNTVTEFDSLRNPNVNKDAADVFGSMTTDQLKASIAKVSAISNEDIGKTVRSVYGDTPEATQLTNTLIARKNYLASKAGTITGAPTISDDAYKSLKQVDANGQQMTYDQRSAIQKYTGNAYIELNAQLRSMVMTETNYNLQKNLDAGLKTLPGYHGVTYRKADLPEEVATRYKPGMVVTETSYTSTSKKAGVWSGSTWYTIHGASGRDVQSMSMHNSEAEVLFPRGTQFKVLSVEKKGSTRHVTMIEMQ